MKKKHIMKNSNQENPELRSNADKGKNTNQKHKTNRIPSIKSIFSNPKLYYRFFILLFIVAVIVIRFFLPVKTIVVTGGDDGSHISENIDNDNSEDGNSGSASVDDSSSSNNSDNPPQNGEAVSKTKEVKEDADLRTNANYASLLKCGVTKVTDGDTIHADGGVGCPSERIRLIGVDTPETVSVSKPVQCYGPEASEYTNQLLGQAVYIEGDNSQGDLDIYGRPLRYIYTSAGENWNMKLILEGYGKEYTFHTAYKYQSQFKLAQQIAQNNGNGLWSQSNCNGVTE